MSGRRVTYVLPSGDTLAATGTDGASVMETALAAGVDGIVAECGGNMMCATCHVYVDPAWTDRVGPPGGEENALLDETASPRRPCSRLSCQVAIGAALDGLVVEVPPEQV